jgi:subtilisin family serine protease
MGQSPLDWIGFGGLRMIIGVVDGGIANSHPSMDDGGFDEPQQRWRGSCDNGIKCNKKLIGAKNLVDNGPPLDVTDGHGTHVASIAAGNFVVGANFNVLGFDLLANRSNGLLGLIPCSDRGRSTQLWLEGPCYTAL